MIKREEQLQSPPLPQLWQQQKSHGFSYVIGPFSQLGLLLLLSLGKKKKIKRWTKGRTILCFLSQHKDWSTGSERRSPTGLGDLSPILSSPKVAHSSSRIYLWCGNCNAEESLTRLARQESEQIERTCFLFGWFFACFCLVPEHRHP